MTATEHPIEHPIAPEDVMAFWDGELPSEKAAIVSAHVAGCDVCQRLGHDMSAVSRDLSLWQVEQAPLTLRAPRRTPVENDKPSDAPARWRRLAPTWLVAGVTVAGLLIVVGGRGSKETRSVALRAEGRDDFYRTSGRSFVTQTAVAGALDGAQGDARGQRQGQGQGQGQGAPSPQTGLPKLAGTETASSGPRIVRTATLRLIVKNLDSARPGVDRILADVDGFVGQIDASGARGGERAFRASLRIPAARLDTALAAFKKLGDVIAESQNTDDVSEQALDLDARLTNARNTEKRLSEVLINRTGKVADVLDVEREIARVREVIERTDAERTNLTRRIEYATLTLDIAEAGKASVDLGPLPVSSRFTNALVEGITTALASALDATLLLVRFGPVTLLWLALAGWPAFVVARRYRASRAQRETLPG